MTDPAGFVKQGFAPNAAERLPLMPRDAMDDAQRKAADELIAGPRKAVFGPFVPLLRSPELMSRVGKLGEYLRFDSKLDARIRELATCITARHTDNQFEWVMHVPLAAKAGVSQAALDAIGEGRYPQGLPRDEAAAAALSLEMLAHNGISDATYCEALAVFGEQGLIELTTLVGYFAMICWVMNVARTPALPNPAVSGLAAFPA
jgi:4-carboxymuconolactone decarboxylase